MSTNELPKIIPKLVAHSLEILGFIFNYFSLVIYVLHILQNGNFLFVLKEFLKGTLNAKIFCPDFLWLSSIFCSAKYTCTHFLYLTFPTLYATMCKITHFVRKMGGQNFHKFNVRTEHLGTISSHSGVKFVSYYHYFMS